MEQHDWIQSDLFFAVTPLYAFVSDSGDLRIDDTLRIMKYENDSSLRLPAGDILVKHFELFKPDYLLWQRVPLDRTELMEIMRSIKTGDNPLASIAIRFQVMFFEPAANFFRLLRLFKSGRLFAGDTFIITTESGSENGVWETTWGQRCSGMTIDYTNLSAQAGSYILPSQDVPFFRVFQGNLTPVLEDLSKSSTGLTQLELALRLYSREEGDEMDVVNALTAFEALLSNDSKAELSYRLSLRVAHLLGNDAEERKRIFKDMKEFYDLRSSLVHGSGFKLKPKHEARLQREHLDLLRDLLRRVILSVMAMRLDNPNVQLEELLDDLIFDDAKRSEVQKTVSKLLHMEGTVSGLIQ